MACFGQCALSDNGEALHAIGRPSETGCYWPKRENLFANGLMKRSVFRTLSAPCRRQCEIGGSEGSRTEKDSFIFRVPQARLGFERFGFNATGNARV